MAILSYNFLATSLEEWVIHLITCQSLDLAMSFKAIISF